MKSNVGHSVNAGLVTADIHPACKMSYQKAMCHYFTGQSLLLCGLKLSATREHPGIFLAVLQMLVILSGHSSFMNMMSINSINLQALLF